MRVGRNVWMWKARVVAGILAAATAFAQPAAAADLRISIPEFARILNSTLQNPKVRVHNLPSAGLLDMTPGSSVTLAGSTIPLQGIDARSFEIAGATYGYYINELNSQSIVVSAVPSALRITVVFESDGPEVVGRCISGLCVSNASLPQLQWQAASLAVDLTPVWVNGKLALDAKRVEVGGTFAAECPDGGFFSGSVCRLALPKAKAVAGTLKAEIGKQLRDFINGPAAQAAIADKLRPFLRLGPVGEVRFTRIAVDAQTVTISFCLACQADTQ